MNNKIKAAIILGGMFAAGLLGGAPASAQTATSTGTNFDAWMRVTEICSVPSQPTVTWKLETGQEEVAYAYQAYVPYSTNASQTGSGKLNGNQVKYITIDRAGGTPGQVQIDVRWGKSAYGHLVNHFVGGENTSCFSDTTSAPAESTSTPAEDPQLISLMERIVDLLKQIIALRLSR